MNRKVIVSGGFDPIHSGHLALFENASKHGDVIVLLNTDKWLSLKKTKPFLCFSERKKIIESIKWISEVREAIDFDGTVIFTLKELLLDYKPEQLIFANGGDRDEHTTPEKEFCWRNGIRLIYGCGGRDKQNSSSSLLHDYIDRKYKRDWGSWIMYKHYDNSVLKELIVEPGRELSRQKHYYRSELWFVAEGKGEVILNDTSIQLKKFDILTIKQGDWHQLRNTSDKVLKIFEVQFGEICSELDIERASQ
jgi:cytidyltransferase-like protein